MDEKVTVWFPAFQKTSHTLNKVAFTLFGRFEVRWYGILITLGIVLAFLYVGWRCQRREGILFDDVIDVGVVTVVLGIIGARAYYVLTSLEDYHSFGEAIAIWNGGLAIYGGIIGGTVGLLLMCAVKKINWRKFFDATMPAVLFAQSLGRWGNFFNGEAYGSEIADTTSYYFFLKEFHLPSGKGTFFHFLRMGLYPNDFSRFEMVFVHPTFLYESIWNLVGFVWINLFYRHKKFDGQVALLCFSWYGFGRMFIEGLRSDSLYFLKGVVSTEGLRISQLVGLLCFVAGMTLLIVFGIRFRHAEAILPIVAEAKKPAKEGSLWNRLLQSFRKQPEAKEPAEQEEEKEGTEKPETEEQTEEEEK